MKMNGIADQLLSEKESRFYNLTERNISPEIFFNSLLSDEDLSKLLCTCRVIKDQILKWKSIFPIQQYITGVSLTDKMFEDMIIHYTQNIKKLTISSRSSKLTLNALNGYSISQLTNLEKLDFDSCFNLDEFSLVSFSTLTMMKSISISRFSGKRVGFNKLLLLVEIKIDTCCGISSEEYHCLSTLTDLTHLSVARSKFDDIGLNLICSHCHLIKYLYLVVNEVTIDGLKNFYFLVHLTSLFLMLSNRNRLIREYISQNIALTQLTVFNDFDFGFSNILIPSTLVNLTYLCVLNMHCRALSSIYLSPNKSYYCLLNLTILELNDNTISKIENLTSLTQVKLNNCLVNHLGLKRLSSAVYLSHLKITNSQISPREFSHISHCTNLTFLDLRGSISSDDDLSHFSSLIRLTHLKFCGVNITEEGLHFLLSLSNTLKYLKIYGCQSLKFIERGYIFLSTCSNLTYLTLSRCIFEKGVNFLKFLFKLSYLDLGPSYEVEHKDLCMISSCLTNLRVIKIMNSSQDY
jgi:hypothetical protein